MATTKKPNIELSALWKIFGNGLIWIALAMLVFVVLLVLSIRVEHVQGTEIGLLLDKTNGKIEVIPHSGVKIYNGITKEFFTLDKTLQTLEMTVKTDRGDRHGRDDLKIKTIDGSDVYVDVKVQYKIIPEMVKTILLTSGPNNLFKEKWARDYIRTICRDYLGELTTEEMYDQNKRRVKLDLARKEANDRVKDFGIYIDEIVIPTKPTFYKEYEEMIKKKKLADQAVLEEHSKALAAKQRQQTEIVTETNKKNVAVEQFQGQMEQMIIQAKAEGEQARKQADAYFDKTTIGAEAKFYSMKKSAEGILAEKKAEATGIEALRKALEGEGGRNMVKLEYARKLKDINISGQPFVIDGRTERFQHLGAEVKGRALRNSTQNQ